MIQHGVLMNEIGFSPLIDKLLPMVEQLSWDLFPEFVGGSGLDSYKVIKGLFEKMRLLPLFQAFTIEYDAETKDHQKDLGTHFDNAEITLNISLTDDHDGGERYFVRWAGHTHDLDDGDDDDYQE